MYVTADGNEEVVMSEFATTLGEDGKYQNMATTDRDSTTPLSEILSDVKAVHGERAGVNTEGATATGTEIKTESWDVKKVSKIITDDTPAEGRTVLLDYLNKVEKEIATEVAGRKADIAALRVQMAKNRAYNAKARASMKKELLARMAVNAKTAKDALDEQMRITAKHFAAAAIKANAIKARQDLDTACDNFNTKMYNVNEE